MVMCEAFFIDKNRRQKCYASMRYYLAKSEPSSFSIEDFEKEGTTKWDGVRNYAALIFLKQMEIGDRVFIYHSNGEAQIVGLGEVVEKAVKDETDERSISWYPILKYLKTFPKDIRVGLKEVKESGEFQDFSLVRQSRLSVMVAPMEFVDWLEKAGYKI
jgi:predicted RNA-binding protein with PUA-like domain